LSELSPFLTSLDTFLTALYHQQGWGCDGNEAQPLEYYQPNLSSKHRRSTGKKLILPPCHKEGSLPDEGVFFSF